MQNDLKLNHEGETIPSVFYMDVVPEIAKKISDFAEKESKHSKVI